MLLITKITSLYKMEMDLHFTNYIYRYTMILYDTIPPPPPPKTPLTPTRTKISKSIPTGALGVVNKYTE